MSLTGEGLWPLFHVGVCLCSILLRNLELEKVREELEQCRATHLAEISLVTRQLRETEEQLEAVRRDMRGTGGDSRDSRGGARKAEGERRRAERRIDRLQSQLKTQVEQSNYLRVKLGMDDQDTQCHCPEK